MIVNLLGCTYFVVLIVFFIKRLRHNSEIELLPSLGWALLMAGPFLIWQETIKDEYFLPQSFGVFVFGFFILAADVWELKFLKIGSLQQRIDKPKIKNRLIVGAFFLLITSIVFQAVHIFLMPKIPLLESLSQSNLSEGSLMDLREKSSKLLDVPGWFIYMCQITVTVFVPLCFTIFYYYKKFGWMVFSVVVGFIYSEVTLAKAPVMVLGILLLMTLWVHSLTFHKFIWLRVGRFAGLMFFILVFAVQVINPRSFLRTCTTDDEIAREMGSGDSYKKYDGTVAKHAFTAADKFRLQTRTANYNSDTSALFKKVNHFFYRTFLVPTEVSHRWYMYYPAVEGAHLGLYGLTPGSRGDVNFKHPANQVGVWAYTKRFPGGYYDSARAYSSIDADAWARGGYLAIFLMGLMVFLLRVTIKLKRASNYLNQCLNAWILALFGMFLPIASLQAVLLAQGVGVLLLIYFTLPLVIEKVGSNNG